MALIAMLCGKSGGDMRVSAAAPDGNGRCIMDLTSLAAVFINAQFGQIQAGAALKILQMKSPQDAALARTLVAIAKNALPVSNVAHGIGRNIDVTA